MEVHFVVNTFREDAILAARDAAGWLKKEGHTVLGDPDSAKSVIAFGGDGTLIRAAHIIEDRNTPILGVYYGRFGFVTQCTGSDLRECVRAFFAGETQIEPRMMVQADLVRGERNVATLHAVNEAILQRSVNERMMSFRVTVDGHHLTSYPADGIIVSTPTGSTAYNLSVGGPIVDPNVQALTLSALAAHTLSARTLVLKPDSEIQLQIDGEGDAVLSADGQTRLHVFPNDVVRVHKSSRVANLVSVDPNDFLIKLNKRLFWSQTVLGGQED